MIRHFRDLIAKTQRHEGILASLAVFEGYPGIVPEARCRADRGSSETNMLETPATSCLCVFAINLPM
jgi:hypothetical protein